MGVGAGIAAAAGIGAVGSIAAGAMSGSAATSAANTQAAAANQATQAALQQYYQTRSDLAPYRDAGVGAVNALQQIYGLSSGAPTAAAPAAAPAAANPLASGYMPAGPTVAAGPQQSGPTQQDYAAAGIPLSGTVQDFIDAAGKYGYTSLALPGGFSLGYNGDASQWMVLDKDGNPVYNGVPLNASISSIINSVAPGSLNQAPAAAPPAPAAPSAPPPNPLQSAYGLPGLTYQTPITYAQILSNPTYQTPDSLQTVLNNPVYQTPDSLKSVLNNPTFQPTQEQLEATPGYQFVKQQGLLGVQNSAAAKGLGVSGAALKGAADYAVGLADNTLQTQAGIFGQNYQRALNANTQGGLLFNQNYANALTANQQGAGIFNQNYSNAFNANNQGQSIFQSNLGNIINPLEWMGNLGQTSAAQTGQLGVQGINNANQARIGSANALAAGQVGSANAFANGINGVGNSAFNYLLFNNLLNGGGGGSLSGATGAQSFANDAFTLAGY